MKSILEVNHLSKEFLIGGAQEKYLSLRDVLSNPFQKLKKPPVIKFKALDDVSFDVAPGESVGIIGRNGAGKSTLLKILSRITPPSQGKIVSRGRIASLLEVGTGFHMELTGRENIYMNGSILGMRKREIDKHFDAIVEFSGVEKFLDTPLKRYSSGMQLRLAFAVAAHLEPEILIIDEVLAVGDAEFQKKCLGKMDEVSKSGRTVLFVSHDMAAIKQLCTKCIYLQKGKIIEQGNTTIILSKYLKNNESSAVFETDKPENYKNVFLRKVYCSDAKGEIKSVYNHDEVIRINIELAINETEPGYNVFLTLLDQFKGRIASAESRGVFEKMCLTINPNFLVRGDYSLHVFVHTPRVGRVDELFDICNFSVFDNGSQLMIHGEYDYGSVFMNAKWEYL
jgi:lipopolysaccharide transport system ATP-binding protein